MSTKITCTKIFLYYLLIKCISYFTIICLNNIDLFEKYTKFCNAVLVKLSYKPRTLNFTQEG